ncbi:MAG: AMP-binding protein, partial [Thermaurantiacus tibetensis]
MSARDLPFVPMGALVAAHGRDRAEAPALTVGEATWSWGRLAAHAARVASALAREGLMPGDAVATLAGSSHAHVALWLGALMRGVAVAPLPTSATAEQLQAMVADSGARLLFRDAAGAGMLAGAEVAVRQVAL